MGVSVFRGWFARQATAARLGHLLHGWFSAPVLATITKTLGSCFVPITHGARIACLIICNLTLFYISLDIGFNLP